MRRVRKVHSSTLEKQEMSETGLNLSVPGLEVGIMVVEDEARGT